MPNAMRVPVKLGEKSAGAGENRRGAVRGKFYKRPPPTQLQTPVSDRKRVAHARNDKVAYFAMTKRIAGGTRRLPIQLRLYFSSFRILCHVSRFIFFSLTG
jgi:hypothetical protein